MIRADTPPAPPRLTTARRAGGLAGIAYAALVAVENFDVLTLPGRDSPIAEIVDANRAPGAKLAINMTAGLLALVAYVVAAISLASIARARNTAARDTRMTVGVAAALAGAALGGVALVLQSAVILGVHNGASAQSIARLHDLRLSVQMIGALPVGLFILCTSLAGARSGQLPRWLTRSGVAIGLSTAIAAATVVAPSDGTRAAVLTLLAAATGWVLVASVRQLLAAWEPARDDTVPVTIARVLAGTVAVAAGLSGVALLAFPGSTADYFSWGLAPAPLAALLGAFYVASSLVYARAAVAPWYDLRIMVVGIVALTVPIFASTLAHLDVFDFGRLQAWAWVVLFAGFLVAACAVLIGGRAQPGSPSRCSRLSRLGAAAVAIMLLAGSVALWIDPVGGEVYLPFRPAPLSGRVLGGWTFLLAVLAASVAIGGRRRNDRLPALAMAAFPAGALLAAARSFGQHEWSTWSLVTLLGTIAWLTLGLALVRETKRTLPVEEPLRRRSLTRVMPPPTSVPVTAA